MARRVCVCAAVLLVTVCQATNIVKVSGLYCQDPDTGNLYAVNSTWPSQTFCGNYTCKMRRKNTTATEYAPIQKFDITKYITLDNYDTKSDMDVSPSENSISIIKKTDNDKQPIFHKAFLKTKFKEESVRGDKNVEDNDGYLTESEIKSITDILHTIKKSDLEAIVDIYNLAQDIYKEIDIAENANIGMETKDPENLDMLDKIKDGKKSYWYEPIRYSNKHTDMSNEETNVITTKTPPLESKPTLLNKPLSVKDFGKRPYYYPMSNFQRFSSYTRPKSIINDLEKSPSEAKPCTNPTKNKNYVALPWYNVPSKRPESFTTARPATLLPYPFSYIYHYNVSGYQPNYYYSYPWTHPEYNKHRNYLQPYYGAYIAQIPSYSAYHKFSVPEKDKSSESNASEEQLLDKLKSSLEKNSLPDWQTGPLPQNVLDEVRAFIEQPKIKPSLLKKNIKLERVGKVLKLDEFKRQKREVIETEVAGENVDEPHEDDLEVYIEKIECENSTEPGYFSYGNMSQPYPSCCPKKLDNIHTTRAVIKVN